MKSKSFAPNKGKTLVYDCYYHELETDAYFNKYHHCHSKECNQHQCPASFIIERLECPFYKRGNKLGFLSFNRYDKQRIEKFKQRINSLLSKTLPNQGE